MRRVGAGVILAVLAAALPVAGAAPEPSPFLPIDQVRPGMTGVGRTIFAGDQIATFQVDLLGVLHNVIGPQRDLILAKLSGGPLADTGVIAGMSGSPVFVDGKLVGAVSYALGEFPKEPLAGITPIGEMMADANAPGGRAGDPGLALTWPATPEAVYGALERLVTRVSAPIGGVDRSQIAGLATPLAQLTPLLRPIDAALVMHGFEPAVGARLAGAFGSQGLASASGARAESTPAFSPDLGLAPGDAVGVSLIRGDFEMGATGTVTYVDGSRVYAFGHPFLGLGPTSMAMTRAHIYTVLPSLASSMKIADMGPAVGTMNEDRASAIGGTLGERPAETTVSLALSAEHAPARLFHFSVLQDQTLTPLFTYVAIVNALTSYERQAGVLTVSVGGTASFGKDGTVAIDDVFTGDAALTGAATAVATPIGAMVTNPWRASMPTALDLHLTTSEVQDGETIERAWLDTTKPRFGATSTLHVLLRRFRGGTEVVSLPVTMPTHASGALSLLVCDGPTLAALDARALDPGTPRDLEQLVAKLNATPRNNRLYVRLIATDPGTVTGGETLPSLPASIRDVLGSDTSTSTATVTKSVLGRWEQRLDHPVQGSREFVVTLR